MNVAQARRKWIAQKPEMLISTADRRSPPLGLGHDIDRNLTDRDSRNKNIKREVMMAIDCGA